MPWLDLEAEIAEEFALITESSEYDTEYILLELSANRRHRLNEKKRVRYAWCKANKTCVDCGKPSTSKAYPKCDLHLQKTLDYLKKSRQKAMLSGNCLRCKLPREAGRESKFYCVSCKDYFNKKWRLLHPPKTPKIEGDCLVCGARVERRCRNVLTCSKKCFQIHEREDLIAKNTCIQCKRAPARTDCQSCVDCSKKPRKQANKASIQKSKREYKIRHSRLGLCKDCNLSAVIAGRCVVHRDRHNFLRKIAVIRSRNILTPPARSEIIRA